ncbi:MAG: hypothetical protein KAX30_06715 [Candidatus Atribacteria bacterium]|nr:hypothetical protein [Candidatus Atribacteria bacterium]
MLGKSKEGKTEQEAVVNIKDAILSALPKSAGYEDDLMPYIKMCKLHIDTNCNLCYFIIRKMRIKFKNEVGERC